MIKEFQKSKSMMMILFNKFPSWFKSGLKNGFQPNTVTPGMKQNTLQLRYHTPRIESQTIWTHLCAQICRSLSLRVTYIKGEIIYRLWVFIKLTRMLELCKNLDPCNFSMNFFEADLDEEKRYDQKRKKGLFWKNLVSTRF